MKKKYFHEKIELCLCKIILHRKDSTKDKTYICCQSCHEIYYYYYYYYYYYCSAQRTFISSGKLEDSSTTLEVGIPKQGFGFTSRGSDCPSGLAIGSVCGIQTVTRYNGVAN
jgi:hypothetical protein